MSAGIPVIGSHFPLWKEIIETNGCGVCVDPLNPKEISKAIIFILNNPEIANKMGEKARRMVEDKYNWEIEKEKLLKIYNEILKK